jgi:hypothetical protein
LIKRKICGKISKYFIASNRPIWLRNENMKYPFYTIWGWKIMLTKPSIIQLHSLYFFKGDKIIFYGFLLMVSIFLKKRKNELIDKVDTETKNVVHFLFTCLVLCCKRMIYSYVYYMTIHLTYVRAVVQTVLSKQRQKHYDFTKISYVANVYIPKKLNLVI